MVDNPVEQPQTAEMTITAKEFERLGLLLRPAESQGSDQGSPMEISPTPFTGLPFGYLWTVTACCIVLPTLCNSHSNEMLLTVLPITAASQSASYT